MVNNQKNKLQRNRTPNAAVTQLTESELIGILDQIDHLQIILQRLSPFIQRPPFLRDFETAELVTRCQSALRAINGDIRHKIASRRRQNGRHQLDNWENEGGSVENVSV